MKLGREALDKNHWDGVAGGGGVVVVVVVVWTSVNLKDYKVMRATFKFASE